MKVTWPLVGIVLLLFLGVLALQGIGSSIFSDDSMAQIDRPDPPCPDGWDEHPRDRICMEHEESCRAWVNTRGDRITRTVSCPVISRDGSAYMTLDLALSGGAAKVTVIAGDGAVVHDDRYTSVAGDLRLSGASGEWTLTVAFENVRGSGTINLWG